ncbi:MAG: hypothetical protein Q9202_005551 [Teloschistes flavicans]
MEEIMYGHGMNMADVLVKEKRSVQSFRSHSSQHSAATTLSANSTTSILKDITIIDFAMEQRPDQKPQVIYLHGFLIIIAKLSDIFGRKPLIVFAIVSFVVFSAACAVAQTLTQLIVLRAFQGIGGGGIYTLVFVMSAELVPLAKFAKIAALLSIVFATSSLLGPILGGLICDHTTWRWVFYLNIPAGILSLVLILISMPRDFPYQQAKSKLSIHSIRRIDFTGFILLLAASVLLVTALEEGGTEYSWRSAVVLCIFFASVIAWIVFFLRERIESRKHRLDKSDFDSVLPWHLITNRFWASMILHAFFTGIGYLTMAIDLPQKFQVVNSDSAFRAGYRLLALMLSFSLAAIVSSVLTEKKRVPPMYTLFAAASLQILGLALMTGLSTTQRAFPAEQYGYEIIMGFGFGLSISTLIMTIPIVVDQAADGAVTMGAIAQARTLGGSVGVSIATNLLNNHLREGLRHVLGKAQIGALLASARTVGTVPEGAREVVQRVYAEGYRDQAIALSAFAGVGLVVVGMMWERRPRRIPAHE